MAFMITLARNFTACNAFLGPIFVWHRECFKRFMRFLGIVLFVALASAQTFPDPVALLKESQANQQKMDEIRENYTFHRTLTENDLDDKGAIVKTTTSEREVFFVNGRQIGRLVKRDGVELKGKAEQNEQARVTKMIEVAMKATVRPRGRGGISMIGDILPMMTISNPRRVSFHDRSALVYDFTGDPHAKAKDTKEGAAKKMAGTIWFDEADRQVARLEVHFYDNFRIGGGLLASVQKGTEMEFERAPIGDGLWMQTYSRQRLAARIVVKNFREDTISKNTDFKKFNVEVLQQVTPPGK